MNSLFVQWNLVNDGVLPGGKISGYNLYIDDGYGGNFKKAYSTVGVSSTINTFLIRNLTTGLYYRLKVEASNFNGVG